MTDLNDYLQAKYAQEEMLANLDAAPQSDFVTIAAAVSTAPMDAPSSEAGAFGWQITGGNSLDLHLAAFNEEVLGRGDDLFIRIAKVETGKAIDFRDVASDVYAGQAFDGRIMNDPTLEAELKALHRGLAEFEARAERLGQAVPAVTDDSFDRYIESLRLF